MHWFLSNSTEKADASYFFELEQAFSLSLCLSMCRQWGQLHTVVLSDPAFTDFP